MLFIFRGVTSQYCALGTVAHNTRALARGSQVRGGERSCHFFCCQYILNSHLNRFSVAKKGGGIFHLQQQVSSYGSCTMHSRCCSALIAARAGAAVFAQEVQGAQGRLRGGNKGWEGEAPLQLYPDTLLRQNLKLMPHHPPIVTQLPTNPMSDCLNLQNQISKI